MPASDESPSSGGQATSASISNGGQSLEYAIPADDTENLIDGGPLDIGRLDVNLKAAEVAITAQ